MDALIIINGKKKGSRNLIQHFLVVELLKEKHHKIVIRSTNGNRSVITLEKEQKVSSVFLINVDKGNPGNYNPIDFPNVHKQYFIHDDYPFMQMRGFILSVAKDILDTLNREEICN